MGKEGDLEIDLREIFRKHNIPEDNMEAMLVIARGKSVSVEPGIGRYKISVARAYADAARPERESWENRPEKRGENPAAFIRRVYREEIDANQITRAALRAADQPLYQAYATWIRRHPEDDLGLPTQSRTYYQTAEETLEARLAKKRVYQARYRLSKR